MDKRIIINNGYAIVKMLSYATNKEEVMIHKTNFFNDDLYYPMTFQELKNFMKTNPEYKEELLNYHTMKEIWNRSEKVEE